MDELISTSLRRLRNFIVVCDTLHLGRAAERLGIAQPALSEQIRGLETGLGIKLFHRRKRGIDLTVAGAAYRIEAEDLLRRHAEAAEQVRRIARGELGQLSVAYVPSAMFEPTFPADLSAMRSAFPGIDFKLREGGVGATMTSLRQGDIDLAVIRAPLSLTDNEAHSIAAREPLVVVMPSNHRLANAKQIALQQLAGEPLVGFDDASDIGIHRVLVDLADAVGVTLSIRWRVSALSSVLGLATAGLGCGIVPAGLAQLTAPGIVFLPLADPGVRSELWYVWRKDHITPVLQRWLDPI
jgi:DNA-binding transcriptional LysR family regulator